jgi:hypothetical protein
MRRGGQMISIGEGVWEGNCREMMGNLSWMRGVRASGVNSLREIRGLRISGTSFEKEILADDYSVGNCCYSIPTYLCTTSSIY